MEWITCWNTNPGVARSILRFSGHSDETLNRVAVALVVGGVLSPSSLTHALPITMLQGLDYTSRQSPSFIECIVFLNRHRRRNGGGGGVGGGGRGHPNYLEGGGQHILCPPIIHPHVLRCLCETVKTRSQMYQLYNTNTIQIDLLSIKHLQQCL